MRVLGIEVDDALVARWADWFAPAVQPFLVDAALAGLVREETTDVVMSDEVRDTFCLYGPPAGARYGWLSEEQFGALPGPDRSALVRGQRTLRREVVPSVRSWGSVVGDAARMQANGHRFVWWPSLLHGREKEVLCEYVEEGRRASRHDEVSEQVWASSTPLLPDARRIAGSFPDRSGPNCFGTVMAAAGVAGADRVWMLREPFEAWLAEACRPGGDDSEPGTVLVWRSPDSLVQHAAVTIGAGWVLHKPSQGWMSPHKVLTVDGCKASSRSTGRRLERHHLVV